MPKITTRRRYRRSQVLTRPNILWVISDDQETGTVVPDVMPFLASDPQGSWVKFPWGVETTPACAIVRATLLTGQRWQRHGVEGNNPASAANLDETATIARVLADAGYRNGLFGKYENGWPESFPSGPTGYLPQGWETFWARSQPPLQDYYNWQAWTNIPGAQTSGGTADADYMTDHIATHAENFVRDPDPRPWMAWVSPGSPHDPAQWPSRHAALDWTLTDPPHFNPADLTGFPAHMQAEPQLVGAEITRCRNNRVKMRRALRSVDEMMDRLITALVETGQLDNTVIIYQTDNSTMMGRKRRSYEGNVDTGEKLVPYQGCCDALLRIRYPGAAQRTDPAVVNVMDLPTSVAAWAGAAWPAGHVTEGSTRVADWCLGLGGNRPATEATFKGMTSGAIPQWEMLLTDDLVKYVNYPVTGEHEVYDLNADPDETVNLYGADATRDAALAARLTQHMADPLHWEV